MTNLPLVCLLLFCATLGGAISIPKACSKGPSYWCENLRNAADCGAVAHCTSTVWVTQKTIVEKNELSNKFIQLFNELKDVKDLINEEYLTTRVSSACHDLKLSTASLICRTNTAQIEHHLSYVFNSNATAETLCVVIGMCNNMKINNALVVHGKKPIDHPKPKVNLVGGEKCTWGPSYWCTNITTGHECQATHHCIKNVWSKMQVVEDHDSICKICTDMVTQARDQLESNQTQEDLKAVFEGSCNLIPIKLVRKECDKLADDFVPELVETLASQMNPQMVCSVAGLCNNENIDVMLEYYNHILEQKKECDNCHTVVGAMRRKFDSTSYNDFLVGLLKVCRKMGSLSDSCSMLTFKYYENIVDALKHDLKPKNLCHLSGQCAVMQAVECSRSGYEFPVKEVAVTDDVPCEFCEQLVVHLRDVMVANTTQLQFFKVLQGLCKQTGSFKDECLSIVNQYYPIIYNYLVSDLKPKEICTLMGICGNNEDLTVAPLIPSELTVKAIKGDRNRLIGGDEMKKENVKIMGQEPLAPLPIERMFINLPESKTECAFCQYFLHYLQVELSDIKTEEHIKAVVEEACTHLPDSVKDQCRTFVTEYGPAVVALLVQEIDPASVCPALGMCPNAEVRKVSINASKSNCPLCLFAVEQLETMLTNNRTESSIRNALDNLCTHLSQKLRTECTDFVDIYSNQLIEMLAADLNAQEVCVYLKLCSDDSRKSDPMKLSHSSIDKFFEHPHRRGDRNNFKIPMLPAYMVNNENGDIETNEIHDRTANGRPIRHRVSQKPMCVVCEFVMKEIDDQIKDRKNEDEIKKIVHGVCAHMPKSVRSDCDKFVEKYADLVISLLAQELDPNEVCQELKLCDPQIFKNGVDKVKVEILDCAICETFALALKKIMINDKTNHEALELIEKACALLPAKYNDRCHTMMEVYGESVIRLIEDMGPKAICREIGICSERSGAILHMYKANRH